MPIRVSIRYSQGNKDLKLAELYKKSVVITLLCGVGFIAGCATVESKNNLIAPNKNYLYSIEPLPSAMPKTIKNDIRKIAIIPPKVNSDSPSNKEWTSSIEEIFYSLPRLKADLKLLERDKIAKILSELEFQMSGLVADNEAVRVGRMLGADHIVLYEFSTASDNDIRKIQMRGGSFVSIIRIKMINVETSEIVYDHISKTLATFNFGQHLTSLSEMVRRVSMEYCSYISQVALNAAFNPSNIGIIFDIFHTGKGAKVLLTFIDSPSERIGLRKGDIILQLNGKEISNAQEVIRLFLSPIQGTIVIEREGKKYTLTVNLL